jgi:hypothetical protein
MPAAPLALRNLGSTGTTVGVPRVTGPHAADFVASRRCASIRAGGACTVDVEFTPRAAGTRQGALRIPVGDRGGEVVVPLRGLAHGGYTRWTTWTKRAGRPAVTDTLTPDDGIRGTVSDRHVGVGSRHGSVALFSGPDDAPAEAGSYTGATWFPEEGRPRIQGVSYGCTNTEVDADFLIHELTYDDEGFVESFSVSYQYVCPGQAGRGSLAWRADRRPPAPGSGDFPRLTVATHRTSYLPGATVRATTRLTPSPTAGTVEVRLHVPGRPGRVLARRSAVAGPIVTRFMATRGARVRARLLENPWPVAAEVPVRVPRVSNLMPG